MLRSIATALFCLLAATVAPAAKAINMAEIDALRAQISADTALEEQARAQLMNQLDLAGSQLDAATDFRARTATLNTEIERAPNQSAGFERKLEEAKASEADYSDLVAADSSVADIEGQITLATAQRQSLGERRSQLIQTVDSLPQRREEIKDRLVTLQQIISTERATLAPGGETSAQKVSWVVSRARLEAAEAEKQYLETEVLGESALNQVNASERAWLGQAIAQADARLAALNAALESARSNATREQLATTSELQEQLQSQDPLLQQFAEENRELARLLQDTAAMTDQARLDAQLILGRLENIEQDSQLMQRRLDVAGRKEVLGRVMITRLDSLPDTVSIKRDIERRNSVIAETSLTQIDIEEDFRALNEGSAYIEALAPELAKRDDATRTLVNQLVKQRAELLERNLTSLGSLLRLLLDNNDKDSELIVAVDAFHQFLLGNLLWIRNFSYLDAGVLADQLKTLANPQNWLQLPAQVVSGYHESDWSAAMLLILLLVFVGRRQLMPVYDELIRRPMLLSSATLWNIVAGLGLSLLLVLPWPFFLYVIGYFLENAEPGTPFSESLGPAVVFSSRILYALLVARMIANRRGVGRRYLKWDGRRLDSFREELNWAGPALCIAILLDVFAYELDLVTSGGPLGAISTAAVAAIIIVFCLRLLRGDIVSDSSMARIGLRLTVFVSAITLTMQAMGLMFAADIYMIALGRSIVYLLIIKTIADVLERWLLILRARMEKDAREALKAQEEKTEEEQEAEIDMMSLSEAHTKLLSMARTVAILIALWLIWSPSLPALNLLESVTLWTVSDSAGALRPITLFDLTFGLVVLVVTALLTRNLPSLSEVFMREWFNMSAGARYATSILMQYLVIAIGGSIFLTSIGWEWSKVQWLVAALGVGIGFGLQEIVANFISGIIILFERPVRVGDIISAGGAEGVVKKINPRATIIETFDRKEHLIPNKELITGQVVNWTLSDAAVRVIIPVGIAYGSDVRQAMGFMLEAAAEAANVLPDPAPRATFEDFGDNALILWLRCYISDDRIGTWTELRTLINDKFSEAGIVISFPQRDVHLDTLEPLQLEIRNLDEIRGG